MAEVTPARRVLITGAAGELGRALSSAWANRYDLRLLDNRDATPDDSRAIVRGDAASAAFMRTHCRGVDTVVHLAGTRDPWSGPRQLVETNVRNTRVVIDAAVEAGCRRVVFASSALVLADPKRPYARAKRVCEKLGQRATARTPLSVICLRLGRVLDRSSRQLWPGAWYLPRVVLRDDAVRAFTSSIEAPDSVGYDVFTVLSGNRVTEFDISRTRQVLGYAPAHDAFALADGHYSSPLGRLRRLKQWAERWI